MEKTSTPPSNRIRNAGQIKDIPLGKIRAGNNDRKEFDDEPLTELADSILKNGLAQPITVRPAADGLFEIVAGERRYRAHRLLMDRGEAVSSIRAIVSDLDDEAAATIMLIENLNRVDINPVEEARAFKSRMDLYGWTVEEIAERTGKSTSVVRSRLAILELDPAVQEALITKNFWVAGCANIAGLDKNRQVLAVNCYIANKKMTGAEWDALIRRLYKEQAEENQGGLFDSGDLELVQQYVDASKAERRLSSREVAQHLAVLLPAITVPVVIDPAAAEAFNKLTNYCRTFGIEPFQE